MRTIDKLNQAIPKKRWQTLLLDIPIVVAGLIVAGLLVSDAPLLLPLVASLAEPPFAFHSENFNISLYQVIRALLLIPLALLLTVRLARFLNWWLDTAENIAEANRQVFGKIGSYLIHTFIFLLLLAVIGIDLTLLAVFGSAIAIGLGFGLQRITSNLVSGLILRLDKSFHLGDLVELNDGISGFVKRIDLRYTLVEGYDGKEFMVPNEEFITSRVTNWTYSNRKARISISVSVAYGSDLQQVHQMLVHTATTHPLCADDPEPSCYLREFADDGINFQLFFWIDNVLNGRYGIQSDVLMSIWQQFRKHGIQIPFPQRDMHIINTSPDEKHNAKS